MAIYLVCPSCQGFWTECGSDWSAVGLGEGKTGIGREQVRRQSVGCMGEGRGGEGSGPKWRVTVVRESEGERARERERDWALLYSFVAGQTHTRSKLSQTHTDTLVWKSLLHFGAFLLLFLRMFALTRSSTLVEEEVVVMCLCAGVMLLNGSIKSSLG